MRWLLHGHLTPAVAAALVRHEHVTKNLADIGLAEESPPAEVLRAAHQHQLDLITSSDAPAGALFDDPFAFDRSIVYLNVVSGDVEQDDAVDRLFARYKRLTPGRLYTVTESRVKVRQLPHRQGHRI